MARSRSSEETGNSTANLGFEAKLWLAADKLRSNTLYGRDKPMRGVSRFGLVHRARHGYRMAAQSEGGASRLGRNSGIRAVGEANRLCFAI